jgi:choline monooxygenase
MLEGFDLHLPLEQAWTPPAAWYTSPDIAALERERVFASTWQYVCPAAWLREARSHATAVVADEPVLVVRDEKGTLRAFSNVCRHRASAIVCEERGSCRVFRCPYHGWTYGLDGRLHAAPEFDDVADFDRASIALPELKAREVGPFVFVAIGAARDLPAALPEVGRDLRFAARRTYEVACNWKVYVDNYLDGGYHVAHLHPSLHGVLDYASYRTDLHDGWNVQHSGMRASAKAADEAVDDVRSGDRARYSWVFPNFMINEYAGVLDTNRVVPLAVDRCAVVFDYWFAAEHDEAFIERSIAVSERIQDEDRDICAAVQRGLASRFYDRGRYSVRRESGEHQFHCLLAEALS